MPKGLGHTACLRLLDLCPALSGGFFYTAGLKGHFGRSASPRKSRAIFPIVWSKAGPNACLIQDLTEHADTDRFQIVPFFKD